MGVSLKHILLAPLLALSSSSFAESVPASEFTVSCSGEVLVVNHPKLRASAEMKLPNRLECAKEVVHALEVQRANMNVKFDSIVEKGGSSYSTETSSWILFNNCSTIRSYTSCLSYSDYEHFSLSQKTTIEDLFSRRYFSEIQKSVKDLKQTREGECTAHSC